VTVPRLVLQLYGLIDSGSILFFLAGAIVQIMVNVVAALLAISIIVSKAFFSQAALFYLAVADGNVAFRLDTAEVAKIVNSEAAFNIQVNQHLKNIVRGVGQDITMTLVVTLIV